MIKRHIQRMALLLTALTVAGNATAVVVKGSVYGGGNAADVQTDATVNIGGGTITGDVFGGGKGQTTTVVGDVVVNIGTSKTENGNTTYSGGTVNGSVYGGSALGAVNATKTTSGSTYTLALTSGKETKVNVLKGEVKGSVFGGGMGQKTGVMGATSDIAAMIYGDTEVTIGAAAEAADPTIRGSVFGGSNVNGVSEDVTITVIRGSITGKTEDGVIKDGNVHGGGLGQYTLVKGSVEVNMGSKTGTSSSVTFAGAATVYGDIYGGSALGNVNAYWDDANNVLGFNTNETTNINLYKGTVKGSVFGGALGQQAKAAVGTEGQEGYQAAVVAIPAYVGGAVTVELNKEVPNSERGCVVEGNIFGCNNVNGSPKGNVTVHVYKTQNAEATQIANAAASGTEGTAAVTTAKVKGRYDVKAVYGGGNEAAYDPTTATSGSKTQVIIEGCEETSIETVYGGGNAAAVPETNVNVKAAYEIYQVFGGGNGKDKKSDGSDNPGADVGVLNGSTYGTGNANTRLEGGLIHEVYGGSNQKGIIKGSINQTSDPGVTCDLAVEKIVGAGKYADIDGDVNMTLGCQPNNKVDVLFAGADEANVNGNITLNITNGHFGQVFGGNNLGGAIKGKITVNVEETGCQPIKIDELYLGSNEAAYSVYGYYESDEVHEVTGRNILKPRESATDQRKPVQYDGTEYPSISDFTNYAQPELNLISCTYIGQVFGGGLGTGAIMYANPTVNVNMIKGAFAGETYGGENIPDRLGAVGDVFGGGNKADVVGNPTVNVGTAAKVYLNTEPSYLGNGNYTLITTDGDPHKGMFEVTAQGAYITGNIYGGGKGSDEHYECAEAMILGDAGTSVNVFNGTILGSVYGGGKLGRVENNTVVTIGTGNGEDTGTPTSAPIIEGNVFGAGAGNNTHGYAALVRGNSTLTVQANAKVKGSVYGGGEMATVGRYTVNASTGLPTTPVSGGKCKVTITGYAEIGPDDMQMLHAGVAADVDKPDDAGHVFGAGQGVLPYQGVAEGELPYHMDGVQQNDGTWQDNPRNYPAYDPTKDLDANYVKFIKTLAMASETEVTISGNAFVKGSVYGGSENGYVQTNTYVTIAGDCQIGNGWDATLNSGDGGGVNQRYTVKYGSDAWTNRTTYPTLPECASWPYGETITVTSGESSTTKKIYAPYDKFASTVSGKEEEYDQDTGRTTGRSTAGGRRKGSDGHTFYGNVFGGGSGYYPYKPGRWFEDAGAVYGDTYVTITGGHILTSVYGGNEMTDVGKYDGNDRLKLISGGSCYVTMIGGTLGVPRTLTEIDNHPVTCYLFGAGKGDQRVFFNKSTNVGNVYVHISDDARIFGSVFGGGEDGHVMKNVTMNIGGDKSKLQTPVASILTGVTLSGSKTNTVNGVEVDYPYIGTWGTSYVEGNVFGAGRGFGGDAYTAGNVAGTVTMNILGGTMLGSIYGAGRLGSVGYGLFDASVTQYYGKMRPDNTTETSAGVSGNLDNFPRGYVYMTIGNEDGTGPTIGNTWEYVNVPTDITESDLAAWKITNHVPNTEYETTKETIEDTSTDPSTTQTLYHHRLKHTKGGNVFAGGMGRLTQLDGTPITAVDWWKLGCVKSTTLTIKGGTIKSNVYGGGELGQVVEYHTTNNVNLGTEITIQGSNTAVPTIGTEIQDDNNKTLYTFGSVFGGGYGSLQEEAINGEYPKFIAGLVKKDTKIDMQDGAVKASIYGGGEMASVGESTTSGETTTVTGSTYVSVSGGTVGIAPIEVSGTKRYFGGAKMGNVYGGGSGHNNTVRSGKIFKNTNVTISGSDTRIYHNIYGGGAYGTVGDFDYDTGNDGKVTGVKKLLTSGTGVATVTVTGGSIGYDGKENGMVFGSSRGDINQQGARDDHTAWVYNAYVNIGSSGSQTGPQINGSVYGSGENGHVFHDTEVNVHSGTIGIAEGASVTSNGTPYEGAAYPYRGNVYGAGCGTDKYYSNLTGVDNPHDGNGDKFNPLAGIVYGTTTVNITGGKVVRNVYGAGAMGSVGKATTTEGVTTIDGGTTSINVTGGTIGVDGTKGDGNVFGAARGDVDATINESALVRKNTSVSVTGGTIKGNVYGGGELGCVGTFTVNSDMSTFTWQNTDGAANTAANSADKNTGICNVSVNGSSAAINGHVFGAGKGKEDTFWCEKGIAYSTNVTISNGTVGTLDANNKLVDGTGNVYGGGEVGRVETDTKVKIGSGEGTAGASSAPTILRSVFGGGAGVETHGYSALVRGNTYVTVEGNAAIGHSVYGGGEIASVGKYGLDNDKMPSILQGGGYCYLKVQGHATIADDVFGAGEGVTPHFDNTNSDRSKRSRRMTVYTNATDFPTDKEYPKEGYTWERYETGSQFVWDYLQTEPAYSKYLETLALATHPEVTIDGNATVNGSVFGGGELGLTKGSVIVTIKGGTIAEDVYGGGSLAHSNTTSKVDLGNGETEVHPTTTVNLTGGTINRDVYGGGLGRLAKDAVGTEPAVTPVEAKVYGTVLVKLNEPTTSEGTTTYGDCVVKGNIFGCNNLNGSPQSAVTVHIYKTQDWEGHGKTPAANLKSSNESDHTYNVAAVYGGGNLAAYKPDLSAVADTATAYVIIDGCDLTSIGYVYGGGNAASVPASEVTINGTYEIGRAFGGGNGFDAYQIDGKWYQNPGANVGYTNYTTTGTGAGTIADPIPATDNTDAATLAGRAAYAYGTGVAHITYKGGVVHAIYGGSNTRGNVRRESIAQLEENTGNGSCPFNLGEAYGGGRSADQDGAAKIIVDCIPGLGTIYGGAENADVESIELNIINGTYDRVFGGNNRGGRVMGSITVNVEETGCRPIIIGELYGGGNQAAYSIYGYKDSGRTLDGKPVWLPRTKSEYDAMSEGDKASEGITTPYASPQVNVKSFTSIGTVFGGGYGASATMVADPTVNINVIKHPATGTNATIGQAHAAASFDGDEITIDEGLASEHDVTRPAHTAGEMGVIQQVFGGGNAAAVDGNPTVNIGTKSEEYEEVISSSITVGTTDVSSYYTRKADGSYEAATGIAAANTVYYKKHTVAGADIRGNVYGGGNAAEVTGNTNVIIGKEVSE